LKLKQKYFQHHILIENFFSLSLLNGINFLLPLITLPYLVRTIGPEKFGQYSYIYVILQYILLFSNYGFNFSATKLFSQNRNDKVLLTRYYNSITICRILLAAIGILILISIIPLSTKLMNERYSIFMGLGIIIGDILIPVWLFQGLEKMRYVTIVNIFSKLLFTILIFIVIKKSQDYYLILGLNSLGYIGAGIISVWLARRQFGINLNFQVNKDDIIFQFRNGRHIFISTLSMNLYRNANIFLLGTITNSYYVGIYSAAEKIIKAIQSLVSPMSESLFPHLSQIFKTRNISQNIGHLYKISKYYSVILLIGTISIIFFSPVIVKIFLGLSFIKTIINLKIMSFVVLFGGLNYLLGIVGLVNLGMEKYFSRFVIISGVLNILIVLLLSPYLFDVSASIAMLASEFFLFCLCFLKLRKLYLNE
jgi:PST family polysaccharide transporter